jgi:hypothetical protein
MVKYVPFGIIVWLFITSLASAQPEQAGASGANASYWDSL